MSHNDRPDEVSTPPTEADRLAESLSRPDCPAELLAQAPTFDSVHLQRLAAAHPSTPQNVLEILFDSRHHWSVRHTVLSRPDLPERIAQAVVMTWQADDTPDRRERNDGTWVVVGTHAPSDLACLAANPATPPTILLSLAGSLLPMVGVEVARNPSTPAKTIVALLNSDDEIVVGAAAANPSIPPEALGAWLQEDQRPAWIAHRAATNPACPQAVSDEVLTWMAIGGYPGNSAFDPESMFGSPNSTGLDTAWIAAQLGEAWPYSALPRIRALNHGTMGPIAATQRTAALLAEDRSPLVRQAVMRLQPLQQSVLRTLLDDPDPAIAKVAKLRLDASVREARGAKGSLPGWLRAAAAFAAGTMVFGLASRAFDQDGQKPLVLPTDIQTEIVTVPTTALSESPTAADPIQIQYLDVAGHPLVGFDLATKGRRVETRPQSTTGANAFWLRDGDRLRLLIGAGSGGVAPAATGQVRSMKVTLAQAGPVSHSKTVAASGAEAALLDVLIDPTRSGTLTVQSTAELAPISITCDLSDSCVAD